MPSKQKLNHAKAIIMLYSTTAYLYPITLVENTPKAIWDYFEMQIRFDNGVPSNQELDNLLYVLERYDSDNNLLHFEVSMESVPDNKG